MSAELQMSQQFLASALDSLSANIAILDEAGTIVAVNASWRRFGENNGLSWPDYGVGKNYLAVVESASGDSAEGAEQAAEGMRELIAGQRDQLYLEYPCHSPNEKRWFELRATRFVTSEGVWLVTAHEDITLRRLAEQAVTKANQQLKQEISERAWTEEALRESEGKFGKVTDITERKWAEEVLRESETRFWDLYHNAPNAYFTVGNDGVIYQCNKRAAELLGYPIQELIGKPVLELYADSSEGREKATTVFQRFLAGESITDEELQMQRSDGTPIWISLTANAVRDAEGKIFESRSMAIDITKRKRVEQALQEAKEAAEAARYEEHERRQESERRRQMAEGLEDVLAALNSNQSLEEVLDLIATQARHLLDTRAVGIYGLGSEVETLAVEASKGLLITYVAGSNIPIGQESLRQAMVSSRPVAVPDAARFPSNIGVLALDVRRRISAGSWANLYRAWLAVPIASRGEVYGGMLLYYAEPRVFSEDEVELAAAFADQAALAIQNSRLRDQIQQAAASAERGRLARDLHDAVTQTLFSASLIAEAMPRVWERYPEQGRLGLDELRRLTKGALAEMRTLLVELRPAALTEKPLDELLRHLAEATTSRTRVPVALTVEGNSALEPSLQIGLYRIAQEALNNIGKHARASQASVNLHCQPGRGELSISDDGCGFNPNDVLPDRLGMGTMRERAEHMGATLDVRSQPGHGTQVIVNWQNTRGEGSDD